MTPAAAQVFTFFHSMTAPRQQWFRVGNFRLVEKPFVTEM